MEFIGRRVVPWWEAVRDIKVEEWYRASLTVTVNVTALRRCGYKKTSQFHFALFIK